MTDDVEHPGERVSFDEVADALTPQLAPGASRADLFAALKAAQVTGGHQDGNAAPDISGRYGAAGGALKAAFSAAMAQRPAGCPGCGAPDGIPHHERCGVRREGDPYISPQPGLRWTDVRPLDPHPARGAMQSLYNRPPELPADPGTLTQLEMDRLRSAAEHSAATVCPDPSRPGHGTGCMCGTRYLDEPSLPRMSVPSMSIPYVTPSLPADPFPDTDVLAGMGIRQMLDAMEAGGVEPLRAERIVGAMLAAHGMMSKEAEDR